MCIRDRSTALSRLNAFLDTELEQLLCFDTEIDAETFCNEKSAIFVIMPEENPNTLSLIHISLAQDTVYHLYGKYRITMKGTVYMDKNKIRQLADYAINECCDHSEDSVSYTHLDVYKRKADTSSAAFI